MSSIYRQFQRSLILNYLVGSSLAVLGVGGATVWMTLGVQGRQLAVIGAILLISLAIMAIAEGLLFHSHMKPIRLLFVQKKSDEGSIRSAYLRAHRLPGLAVRRIMGPHMLGFMTPALVMSFICMSEGWLVIPSYYLLVAAAASMLIACLHALIEFFLTAQAVRPLLVWIRQHAVECGVGPLSLKGRVLIPIQRKFQLSVFVIGTLPVLLFCCLLRFAKRRMDPAWTEGITLGRPLCWSSAWASLLLRHGSSAGTLSSRSKSCSG